MGRDLLQRARPIALWRALLQWGDLLRWSRLIALWRALLQIFPMLRKCCRGRVRRSGRAGGRNDLTVAHSPQLIERLVDDCPSAVVVLQREVIDEIRALIIHFLQRRDGRVA